jgi:RNA polymerase subunit RPABC4/transcription elongation factor Spt4
MPQDPVLTCEKCDREVTDDDAFCPNCGSLFTDLFVCESHPSTPASGVCVICQKPCCEECGGMVKEKFVCREHARYEIREGMARVLWNGGTMETQQAATALGQAGLHPFTIADYELFVPFSEVPRAEEVLNDMGFRSQ